MLKTIPIPFSLGILGIVVVTGKGGEWDSFLEIKPLIQRESRPPAILRTRELIKTDMMNCATWLEM